MEVSRIIEHIGDTEVIGAKFQKRLVVVETIDEKYPQLIPIEFTQDKVSMLDDLTEGEEAPQPEQCSIDNPDCEECGS